jgi:hypothetical protein
VTDPILDAHRVLPGFFLLSGGPSPISIRDQMLRGWMVTDRLVRNKVVHRDAPLLVIGAGVGGATAAIWAAENKVRTLLIDKALKPFGVQRRASTRFLNPTQYDWPVNHWPFGVFPWLSSHVRLPLPYPSDNAANLAALWEAELLNAVGRLGGLLAYHDVTSVQNIDPASHSPALYVTLTGQLTGNWAFGAIIWAAGAGREDCRIFRDPKAANPDPIYEGRGFWSDDPFAQQDCGVPGKPVRALISGGGDGALQDYLRIVTRFDAAEMLYRRCNIPREISDRIQSAEDRAHRGRVWVDEDRAHRTALERPFLWELQQEHEAAVEDAVGVKDVSDSLGQMFASNPPPKTILVYREPYFTNYYGLNRFLVLLVARYLERRDKVKILHPQTVITGISTAATDNHDCMVQVAGKWEPAGGYANPICHGRNRVVK